VVLRRGVNPLVRQAALAAERGARDGESRRPLWARLADGALTIVDSFDAEGRWLLVARVNPLDAARGRRLSAAESAVVVAAADGHSNKAIGHALGLAASTVANHLSSAAVKLGVRSRVELIMVYHALNPRTHF
jgi:DNA-binding NarL/FixJ family response regulator